MRWSISRPSRRLTATMVTAVALSACATGVTSLVDADDVRDAVLASANTSRSVLVTTDATLDPVELAMLPRPDDAPAITAEDVARMQTALDRTSVQLDTAEDGSRRAALLWDSQVAVDVRVDASDVLVSGAEPVPFDLAASARVDVGVVLQMVLTLQPDVSPADLLDLRSRLGAETGAGAEERAAGLPDEVAEVARTLLAGEWVTIAGTIDPAEVGQGDRPDVDMTAVRDAVTSAVAFSDPAPDGDGYASTATVDVAGLIRDLQALAPAGSERDSRDLDGVELVLVDLVQLTFDADGLLSQARTDVLATMVQGLTQAADVAEDPEHADRARAVADIVAGWTTTTVSTVATVTETGAVDSVLTDVEPGLSLTWDRVFELAEEAAERHSSEGR